MTQEKNQFRFTTWLAIGALILCVIQWSWFNWRLDQTLASYQLDLRRSKQYIDYLEARDLMDDDGVGVGSQKSSDKLSSAIRQLGSDNLLKRYQAGMSVREYGAEAIPKLLQLVKSDDTRAQESAFLLLAEMEEGQAVVPKFRAMLKDTLGKRADTENKHDNEKLQAGLVGLLTRYRDKESVPLFSQALESPYESVRGAAILGLRRIGSLDALPQLVSRLGEERNEINQQLQKVILQFCQENPVAFQKKIEELEPRMRYQVVRLLSAENSTSAVEVLQTMVNDQDPRVALTAAHLLAKRGDKSGLPIAKKLAGNTRINDQLRNLAAEIEALLSQ